MKNFIAELLVRLFKGKPKFFHYVQVAAIVIGALAASLDYLKGQDVNIPYLSVIGNSVVYISSIVAAIIAQLPNKDVQGS
jgi:hypothetical protein